MSRSLSRTSGRRSWNRSGSSKLLTARSANRKFAKRKVEWVVPFSASCGQFCATPGDVCPNGGSIVLLTNAELIGKFEDATRIVKIEGDLFFQPTLPNADDCVTLTDRIGRMATYFRMGLKKSQVTQLGGGIPQAYNPLKSGATPEDLSDYADGKWLKLWPAHLFQPRLTIGYQQNPVTCCPDVTGSGGSTINTLELGSGNIDTHMSISTECLPCGGDQPPLCVVQATAPGYHHIRVAYNRPLRMTGDDSLALYFGWESQEFCGETARHDQVNMQFTGQIRMLIEK